MKQVALSVFIFFINILAYSQSTSYTLGDFPSIFSEIEKLVELEETESILTSCDKILADEHNSKIKGIAYFYKGQAEALSGNHEFATRSFNSAIKAFQAKNYEKGIAFTRCKQAELSFSQNDFSTADKYYDLSIDLAQELELFGLLTDMYEKKSIIYTNPNESTLSIGFLKSALKYAELIKDQERINLFLNQISTNYHSSGQLDSAAAYFEKAIQSKEKIRDLEGLTSDYIALGKLQKEKGNYPEAQKNLVSALRIAESEKDTFYLTTILSEIGDVYASQSIWSDAEKNYRKALALAQSKNSKFAEAGCHKNLGSLFIKQSKIPQAIESYEAALEIYKELNSKINIGDVLTSLGQLYNDNNQFAEAKIHLKEALALRSNSSDKLGILSTKLALAWIEIDYGDLSTGLEYANQCLAICQEIGDKKGLSESYALLAKGYASAGEFEKAYGFHQLYKVNSDSLISVDKTKAINELELRYKTEKMDKEIAQQRIEIEAQNLKIQERNNQLLLLGGGLTVFGLLITLLFFINRKNQQLSQQKIEVLNREQETKLLKAILKGEEKERIRIGRELHDGLGAVLATVKMFISNITYNAKDDPSKATFQKAESMVDDACKTVREISHDLMPGVLEEQGLNSAIEKLCKDLSNNDSTFYFYFLGEEKELNDVIQPTIYRIVQELLKNSIKHAEASEVIVQISIDEKMLTLEVEDDGKGFDTALHNDGIGLKNIRSRTEFLKGTFNIESTPKQGSTFTIQVPLNAT